MKRLLASFLLLTCSELMAVETTNFNTVTLGWNANTETNLAGYRLYFSQSTSVWTHVKNSGLVTQTTVSLPSPGIWRFVVTATDVSGLESDPSNMVTYTNPAGPAAPSLLRVLSATITRVSTVTTATNIILVP